MRNLCIFQGVLFICLLLPNATKAGEDNRLIPRLRVFADVRPEGIFYSRQINNLQVTRGGEKETIDSRWGWAPSARAGVTVEFPILDVKMSVGTGFLAHKDLYGGFYRAGVELLLKPDEYMIVGPHFGVLNFDSVYYNGDADVMLNNNAGWVGGVMFKLGHEQAAMTLALNYLDCELDIYTSNGWVSQYDELNISGVILQAGFEFRF